MTNRQVYLTPDHRLTIKESPAPEPRANEVLIRIAANGICGSDIHFFANGRLGNFVVDAPYVPGHEASGTVVKAGADAAGFRPGDPVAIEPGIACGFCPACKSGRYNLCPTVVFLSAPPINGTFCDFICVRADCVHHSPPALALEHAALVEPAAVGVHAVNQAASAGIISGKSAVILGSGTIGLMTAQAFKAAGGGHVTCVDVLAGRLELAQKLGADKVLDARSENTDACSADIIFETAGLPSTTAQCFSVAKPGGTVVQVGWPTGNTVSVNIADFIEKELTYKSVNRYANAFPTALTYLADGRIRVSSMITQRFNLTQAAEAFAFAHNHPDKSVKVLVTNN